MDKELFEQIFEKLEKELNIEKSVDFIGELLDERSEMIHLEISDKKEYKAHVSSVTEIEEEIGRKISNPIDIISLIEEHENEVYENYSKCEKLMYKYGLYDGMKLVIEGMKLFDIKEKQ